MKTELNTNTRPLRRNPDLSWSAGSQHPCVFCSVHSECERAHGEASVVCRDTVPALSFQDEVGLSHLANTFRVGQAWMQRLRIGDRVGLYNTLEGRIFGFAHVIYLASGPIAGMMRDHAHANHLMLDRPHHEAPRELLTWQRKNYGPRIINADTKVTAIYLLREPQQAPAAAPQGQ